MGCWKEVKEKEGKKNVKCVLLGTVLEYIIAWISDLLFGLRISVHGVYAV
jgi:hypothetical protein